MEFDETESCKKIKAMSPGNLPIPSGGGSWDSSGAVMSPFAPDMNSIASGSFMQGYGNNNNNNGNNSNGSSLGNTGPTGNSMARSNSFDFSTELLGGGPLSQLCDSVNSLDPLSSIEKTINEQVGGGSSNCNSNNCHGGGGNSGNNTSGNPLSMPAPPSRDNQPHTPQTGPNTPHTPHTPGQQALTPAGGNGPPSVGNQNTCGNHDGCNPIPDTTSADLPDLDFDPEAVINGEGAGNESLNVR